MLHSDLTIKGITKPVDFELEFDGVSADPWGGTRAGFSAEADVNRKDWGLEWNVALETGGVLRRRQGQDSIRHRSDQGLIRVTLDGTRGTTA